MPSPAYGYAEVSLTRLIPSGWIVAIRLPGMLLSLSRPNVHALRATLRRERVRPRRRRIRDGPSPALFVVTDDMTRLGGSFHPVLESMSRKIRPQKITTASYRKKGTDQNWQRRCVPFTQFPMPLPNRGTSTACLTCPCSRVHVVSLRASRTTRDQSVHRQGIPRRCR